MDLPVSERTSAVANVRQVTHFTLGIEDAVGSGARVLESLRSVNLIAVWGYSMGSGKATLEIAPEDPDAFVAAAKAANIEVGEPSTVFYLTGDDRPGTVADTLGKLAGAGVSIGAAQGIADGRGHFGAMIYVAATDVAKVASVLGAS
jgi:hypothetical protein